MQPASARLNPSRLVFFAALIGAMLASSGAQTVWAQSDWSVTSHLRTGYYGTWGEARDGSQIDDHSLSGRLRVRPSWQPVSWGSVHASGAIRFASTQPGWTVRGLGYYPGSGGYAPGDIGIDGLFARWQPNKQWQVDAGRLRLGLGLPDMMGRGLHRNDGSNIAVQWTDGVHVQHRFTSHETAHVAAFHTPSPPTTAFRSPLRFTASGSNIGWFGLVESSRPVGPLVHHGLHVSVLPAAAPTGPDREKTYVAVSLHSMAERSIGEEARLAVAAEVGWVPTPLSNEVLGLDPNASLDPIGLQASLNLLDIGGAHSFAVQGGLNSPHWLISTDFRPNEWMTEARYYWRFHENFRFDVRLRLRQERWQQVDAVQRRTQYDTYIRLNIYLP